MNPSSSYLNPCSISLTLLCVRFVEIHGVDILEQNLYRNFMAHLTALQQENIVGAETLLRNVLNVASWDLNIYFYLDINRLHSKVLDVRLKMFPSAISLLQKKIIGSRVKSSWQHMWR